MYENEMCETESQPCLGRSGEEGVSPVRVPQSRVQSGRTQLAELGGTAHFGKGAPGHPLAFQHCLPHSFLRLVSVK